MAENYTYTFGKWQNYTGTLPVDISTVEPTNVFVDESGNQTFKTEDGQDFRTEQ